MITKYFKSVTLKFPPVSHSTKLGRIFMANLPPKMHSDINMNFHLLQSGTDNAELKVTYKDGTTISADINNISSNEMIETFDRYSRKLQFKDSISE